MTGPSVAVRFRNLHKDYVPPLTMRRLVTLRWRRDRVPAVCGVEGDLEAGRVHAFVGPNGAGKTTLLQLVCALLWPTRGSVEVLGVDTRRDPGAVRALVGYCITEPRSFFLRLSGRENLRFFAALHRRTGRRGAERVGRLLRDLELDPVADRTVLSYSEGMKQRLAIARALLHEPRILLLDEVGRGLDPRLREKVFRHVREDLVRGHGVTVLMASHNLDEVAALADRVFVMDRGRVAACGDYEEVRGAIEKVFQGADPDRDPPSQSRKNDGTP